MDWGATHRKRRRTSFDRPLCSIGKSGAIEAGALPSARAAQSTSPRAKILFEGHSRSKASLPNSMKLRIVPAGRLINLTEARLVAGVVSVILSSANLDQTFVRFLHFFQIHLPKKCLPFSNASSPAKSPLKSSTRTISASSSTISPRPRLSTCSSFPKP